MPDDHLLDVLTRGRKPAPREEGGEASSDSNLPDPDQDYEPYGHVANKPLFSIHFILGRTGFRSFQYVHLDSDSGLTVDGEMQVIRLQFCGSKTTAVAIHGRNLWQLHDYIHQHRMPWVMPVNAGRDFAGDGQPAVTAIRFEEKSPEGGNKPSGE